MNFVIDHQNGVIMCELDDEIYYYPLDNDLTVFDVTLIRDCWGVVDDYDVEDPERLAQIKKALRKEQDEE